MWSIMLATILVADVGIAILVYYRIRWSVVSLWPAVVVMMGLMLALQPVVIGASRLAFAVGAGAVLYGMLLVSWLFLGPPMKRHFKLRF
jgi:hypothetical protein